MSNTTTGVHGVVNLIVYPVRQGPHDTMRWQTIVLQMRDGSKHEVTAFLLEGAQPLPVTEVHMEAHRRRFDPVGAAHYPTEPAVPKAPLD